MSLSPLSLFFSTFEVSRQAFYRNSFSYAIVNLKPIVPGRMSMSWSCLLELTQVSIPLHFRRSCCIHPSCPSNHRPKWYQNCLISTLLIEDFHSLGVDVTYA